MSADQGFSFRSIAAPDLILTTDASLISPMNLASFGLGSLGQSWILFVDPLFDLLSATLISSAHGLLGGEPPPLEIMPNCPDRHVRAIGLFNELTNCFTRPEGERELQLVRSFLDKDFTNALLLELIESLTASFRSSCLADFESFNSTFLSLRNPFPNLVASDSNN